MSIRSSVLAGFHCVRAKGLGFALIGLVMVCAVGRASAGITPQYTLTDLGVLPGTASSYAAAINDSGQVVGTSSPSGPSQAFLYSGGNLQDLGGGGTSNYATGINASGQVVGYSVSPGVVKAFLYSNGARQDLGAISSPGVIGVSTAGINASGQVAGTLVAADRSVGFYTYAFLYQNGTPQNLLGSPPAESTSANAINSRGDVVGNTMPTHSPAANGFLYSNGVPISLSFGYSSSANAINDSGQAVGTASTGGAYRGEDDRAFIYSNGTMTILGTLGGVSDAHGINDLGQVVGNSALNDPTKPTHGFLYMQGTMYDLNALLIDSSGYVLTDAVAINAGGQIAADAITPSGQEHAVLLTPTAVPLPPAAWACITALPLLWASKRIRWAR